MKTLAKYKIILSVLIISIISIILSISPKHHFTEKQALTMLFGNYNAINKTAVWKDKKFPEKQEADSFWNKRVSIVKPIFFQPYHEGKKNKFFLLTKTIPIDIPFDCHACLPLIGATVFVLDKNDWVVESQNLFVMYAGEYAEPITAKLIAVGKNKMGLLLEFEHIGDGFYKEKALLVPYNKKIENSHQESVYYENFSDCGRSIQCAAFTASFEFHQVKYDNFYELKIRRFGTENDMAQNGRAVPVDVYITYKFVNGKYSEIDRKGVAQ